MNTTMMKCYNKKDGNSGIRGHVKFLDFINYCLNTVLELPKRIIFAFVPFVKESEKHLIDILGPSIAIVTLITLLEFGVLNKLTNPSYVSASGAISIVLTYILFISLITYISTRLAGCNEIKYLNILTMYGYSFYGYNASIALSLIIKHFYYTDQFINCLIFTIVTGIKIISYLLFSIETPVIRLLLCSFVGCFHILFLVYLYYAYIHPTFTFGKQDC